VVALGRLPRREADGTATGGFSALVYRPERDELLLLSDAPQGRVLGWRGLAGWPARPLQPLGGTPLAGTAARPLPAAIDGEGIVLRGEALWVSSEGRRTAARPAGLLRFAHGSGRLRESLPLPEAWRPGPARGLEANRGPESLTLLERPGRGPQLLTAAESPLRQDPPGQVRLVAWPLAASGEEVAGPPEELRPLAIPPQPGWGLTELLALPSREGPPALLGLWRSFETPDRWQARLALYDLPAGNGAGQPALAPRISWNLLGLGLPADNWEGLAFGPPLADGRPTLLLVSDDNFSPLQDNHLARIAPRRRAGCPPRR
jgi:hypothetical protein